MGNKFSRTVDFRKWVKIRRRRKGKRERAKVGNNNGQLRIATPPRVAHAKTPGPKEERKLVITMASYALQTPPPEPKAEDVEKEKSQ